MLKATPKNRREQLRLALSQRFGIDLNSLVESSIQSLLEALPQTINPNNPRTQEVLLDASCIGETFFLRHSEHFKTLGQALHKHPKTKPIRVWSAGCCTGEEAYSLNGTLIEEGFQNREILGTDLNPKFLEKARQGRYSTWSLRLIDNTTTQRWLTINPSSVSIQDWLRQDITFQRLNLMDIPEMTPFDVIFCRNVLMYFCPASAQAVFHKLALRCRLNGLLFTGYFDPHPNSPLWAKHELNGVRYFRRVTAKKPPAKPKSSLAKATTNKPRPAPEVINFATQLNEARRLASLGAHQAAMTLAECLCKQQPLELEPYILMALIADEVEAFDKAIEITRKACFLAPYSAMAQYLRSLAFSRLNQPKEAAKHRRLTQKILDSIPDLNAPLPHAQGLTGHQLRSLVYER